MVYPLSLATARDRAALYEARKCVTCLWKCERHRVHAMEVQRNIFATINAVEHYDDCRAIACRQRVGATLVYPTIFHAPVSDRHITCFVRRPSAAKQGLIYKVLIGLIHDSATHSAIFCADKD